MVDVAQRVADRFARQGAIVSLPVDFAIYFTSMLKKMNMDARRIDSHVKVMVNEANRDEDIEYATRRLDYRPSDLENAALRVRDILDRFDLNWRVSKTKTELAQRLDLDRIGEDYEFKHLKHLAESDLSEALGHLENYGIPTSSPFVRAYKEVVELVRGIVQRVEKLRDRFQGYKNLKPEKIEKLYHASVNARALHAKGFQLQRPEGGMGLGGSVEDSAGNAAISFTHDLAYALQIARWFKEMAMVAAGDIKASQIFRLAEKEGIADKVLETASGLVSTVGDYMREGRVQLDHKGGKLRVVRVQWVPAKNEVVTEVEDPDELFKNKRALYDLYLSYILQSPHRQNPMSMNVSRTLEVMERENVQPRDIGVITAEVDMSDPDIKYMPAEAEYRVPPRAIIKVLRFVGE